MKKVSFFVAFSFLAASTMFTSCKKDATTEVSEAQVADAQDNAIASSAYDDVDTEVDESSALKSATDDAAPVETKLFKKGGFMRELTFNGIKRNGKVKSGKIIVTVTYPTTGDSTDQTKWVKTITFENYTVGERKIEGTKTITFKGKVNGIPEWEIKLVGGKVTFKNGKTITYEFTRTRRMIAGSGTTIRLDDVFEFNGSGSGTNRKGISYTTTTTAVTKAAGCPYFKSGVVSYVSDTKTVVITYSGGTDCLPTATIEVDGKVKTVDCDAESSN